MTPHVKTDLPAYFNGDLSNERRQEVEAHLGTCASCRGAANKLRAKASRGKRQALKGAVPDRVPNLLLTRLGRQTFGTPQPSPTPWVAIFIVVVIVAVIGWAIHRSQRWSSLRGIALTHFSPMGMTGSSATASGFDVEHSSPSAERAAGAAAGAAPSQNAALSPATPVAVTESSGTLPQWSGQDSNIKDAREVVVRNRPNWRALWYEMGQPPPAPHVNFNDFVVLGIFTGERPAGQYQITLDPPIDQDDAIIIPYKISGPAASAAGGTTPVHPYLVSTLQRSPKPIRFRLEEQ